MPDPVSYTAALPIGESTVAFVSGLLNAERRRRRTAPAAADARWGRGATRCWCCAGSSTPPASPSSHPTIRSAVQPPTGTCTRHRRSRRRRAGSARRAARRAFRGTLPRQPRRHPDPHRPPQGRRTDREGGPLVVGQAPPSRRECAGRDRTRSLATVDLLGPPGPRARRDLRSHPSRTARRA